MSARARDFAPTIVALRALGLGDVLTAIPAWRAVARAFPGYRRLFAIPPGLAPIADLVGAEVLPVTGLGPMPEVPVTIAVNLHGRGPESDRVLLERKPVRLIAFANRAIPETCDGPEWRAEEHEVDRWCRLLLACDIAADASELDLPNPVPRSSTDRQLIAAVGGSTTVVHPGASAGARRWPAPRFASVVRSELATGRRVVITGSPRERTLCARVAALAGLSPRSNLAGRTDVVSLALVVARAGRVVCGDTGVAHLATALRTPSVVLFGPTSPVAWGPPRSRPWHVALWAGRSGDPHATPCAPGLLDIAVGDVVKALAELDRYDPSKRFRNRSDVAATG